MKSNTNKSKKSNTRTASKKGFAVGMNQGQVFASVPYTSEDFKNSLLIVSLIVNMFILTAWIVVQVNETYALTVAQSLVK